MIEGCIKQITELPQSELKYHLTLLINSIRKKEGALNKKYMDEFLDSLSDFLTTLNIFLEAPPDLDPAEILNTLVLQYQQLTKIAKTHTFGTRIYYGLLNVGSCLAAIFLGIAGALIGGPVGLARGIWTLENPFTHTTIGHFTGFMVGSIIGFRLPKKLFKNELTRQLKFCLDGIGESMNHLQEQWPFSHFQHKVEKDIKENYFNNDDEAFQTFLNKDVEFKVVTLVARFVPGNQLEGFLGHHALIVIPAFGNEGIHQLEFTASPSDISRNYSQSEKRTVPGQTIIDMIAIERQFQESNPCATTNILKKMKPGDNDCFSYVNKILIGTNQPATTLRRFDGSENGVGRHIIGFFIQKLSPFSQTILDNDVAPLQPVY